MNSLKDILHNAGWVVWPLGLCSILALGIVIYRVVTILLLQQKEENAFAVIRARLEKDEDYAPGDPALDGAPITQIMDILSSLRGATEESLWQAADVALSLQRLRFRRFLNGLATIGSISPFIGLLGTVIGVMNSFHTMSTAGLNNEKISGDIAEALSATALGLLVAIPSVVAYNILLGWIQTSLLHVHGHVARLIPLLRMVTVRQKQEV